MLVPWYLVAFEIIGKSGSVCNHSVFKAILVHQDVHKAWWSRSAVWLDGVSLSITSSLIDKLNVVVSAGQWTLHLCRNITRLQAAESSPLMLLRVNKVSGSLPPCDRWGCGTLSLYSSLQELAIDLWHEKHHRFSPLPGVCILSSLQCWLAGLGSVTCYTAVTVLWLINLLMFHL